MTSSDAGGIRAGNVGCEDVSASTAGVFESGVGLWTCASRVSVDLAGSTNVAGAYLD